MPFCFLPIAHESLLATHHRPSACILAKFAIERLPVLLLPHVPDLQLLLLLPGVVELPGAPRRGLHVPFRVIEAPCPNDHPGDHAADQRAHDELFHGAISLVNGLMALSNRRGVTSKVKAKKARGERRVAPGTGQGARGRGSAERSGH